MSRTLLYVAYPMRLDLGAANAIQTISTIRELRRVMPGVRLVVPRWLREKSAFTEVGALHLPRPAINKLSRLLPWAGWSYIERSLYCSMLALLLLAWRLVGKGYRALYVRDSVCAAWLVKLRALHGAKVIYEVHDLEASHPSKASKWPRPFWGRALPWLDKTALRGADTLVSLTETFKLWAIRRGVRKASHIVVIPDAFDPMLYFPQDVSEARRVTRIIPGASVIGYAGLTFAYRRLDLLVSAFAIIQGEFPGALLVLVGGRPHEVAELRALAGELGIAEERLIMPGQVTQVESARYLNASDVLVIPDTVTGMTASPLKLFEYMATGKPIVCKDMPALREILGSDSARFFRAESVPDLADAIRDLLLNPSEGAKLGEAALEKSAGYTYRARANRIAGVVRGVLSSRPGEV